MIWVIKKIISDINKNKINGEKEYFLFHQYRFVYIFSLLQEYDKNKLLLDIGAHYLHGLLGAHYLGFKNIFGTDLDIFNSSSADRAKKINAVIKNCNLEKESISFSDQSFDIVLLAETLEHFNFHPKKVFNEIARVLKPNGELIITTPNFLRSNNRLKCIMGKSINFDIREDYTPGTHYREYSVAEIEYLLNIAGLKMKKLKYIDFDYPNRSMVEAIINKAIGFLMPSLQSNIVIVGKKE